jgi:hypothetical protein
MQQLHPVAGGLVIRETENFLLIRVRHLGYNYIWMHIPSGIRKSIRVPRIMQNSPLRLSSAKFKEYEELVRKAFALEGITL